MAPGSVIVDLAAETGGNCALTEPGETVVRDGVTIVGETNLPSTMPFHASQMYSRNVSSFLGLLVRRRASWSLDFEDEIVRETCVTHDRKVLKEVARRMSAELVSSLTIFALAALLGLELIGRVPALLHTPLMSGTNAIHGIIARRGDDRRRLGRLDGRAGARVRRDRLRRRSNVVGGFLVTDRMLDMFKRRPERDK